VVSGIRQSINNGHPLLFHFNDQKSKKPEVSSMERDDLIQWVGSYFEEKKYTNVVSTLESNPD
jgi:hypothetical protein